MTAIDFLKLGITHDAEAIMCDSRILGEELRGPGSGQTVGHMVDCAGPWARWSTVPDRGPDGPLYMGSWPRPWRTSWPTVCWASRSTRAKVHLIGGLGLGQLGHGRSAGRPQERKVVPGATMLKTTGHLSDQVFA